MAKDPREYGYEGEMVVSQLRGIMSHAQQLQDMLKPDSDLPEWVQSKITLAYDYIQTSTDYMNTEIKEDVSKPFARGQTVYVTKENPNLQNTPTQGRIHAVYKNHVVLRTSGGTGLYKAHKDNISHNSKESWLHKRYQKEDADLVENITTERDPIHNGVHHVFWKGTKMNVRIVNGSAGVIGGAGRGSNRGAVYSIHFPKTGKYVHAGTLGQAKRLLQNKMMQQEKNKVNEDTVAPTNSAGTGNIAGIGVGPKGEPGVSPKAMKKYRAANAESSPVLQPMQTRKTLQQFRREQ